MIRVNVICEGQTEEEFVKSVLYSHFIAKHIILNPIVLGKGDNYDKLKFYIRQKLKEDQTAFLTMMVDLYGMGKDFPGYNDSKTRQPHDRAKMVEQAIFEDIQLAHETGRRFIPFVQLHEFEALLFSNPHVLEQALRLDSPVPEGAVQKIRNGFETPEHINDNPMTSPSWRIRNIAPSYNKRTDGNLIALEIGLNHIRQECPHFNAWIGKLEALGN